MATPEVATLVPFTETPVIVPVPLLAARSYAAFTALGVAANASLVLFVALLNSVTPYLLVVAAGILAVPLEATSVPFACTFVIVPVLEVYPLGFAAL